MSSIHETQSAGGVVVNNDGLVLVANQKSKSWSLPKGHVEQGEDKIETAKREIHEETGVDDLEFVSELGSYQRYKMSSENKDDLQELKHITIFLFKTNHQGPLSPTDPENPEARWVKKEEVAEILTHPKDKEFFRSIVDKI
ncbi:NUDIX domain-containing protein [Candidatus Microgenomates bacterium]|nr:NUDIX domain-containing protein [Candidatus Microgenomates bacterium]